jgi:hypothetical protein
MTRTLGSRNGHLLPACQNKEMVGDSQEIETITTYGAEVTIP